MIRLYSQHEGQIMSDQATPAAPAGTPQNAPASQLTAREHVALTLRLPASGTQWLDAMINHAVQREAIEQVYRNSVLQLLDEANLAIIRKNGIDAWLKANGADLEATRRAAEVMIKPLPKSQAKTQTTVANAPASLQLES
jgi:hypothetical protein